MRQSSSDRSMQAKPQEEFNWIRDRFHTKGKNSLRLEWHILKTCGAYSRLIVRQLYYILISRFKYPATRRFYKRLSYHLTKMRRLDPRLNARFIDPTRRFVIPPLPYPHTEIWVEKDSIRNFIGKLAVKYRLGIQVLRGFASLSMYRRALNRARKRGVTMILYLGDHDPSGLQIEKVAQKEMKISIKRIILTLDQVKRFRPPSRPVNRRDSRAKTYMAEYGDRCWEVEALRPRTLFKLVETKLRENVPPEFLEVAETKEQAARVTRPITEKWRKRIEKEAFKLLEEGVSTEEILRTLSKNIELRSAESTEPKHTHRSERTGPQRVRFAKAHI